VSRAVADDSASTGTLKYTWVCVDGSRRGPATGLCRVKQVADCFTLWSIECESLLSVCDLYSWQADIQLMQTASEDDLGHVQSVPIVRVALGKTAVLEIETDYPLLRKQFRGCVPVK